MKRVLIGGFMSLIGSIWALTVVLLAANNLTSEWATPPGRLLTTISELSMMPLFVLSSVFVLLGMILMALEYFRKES